MLHLTHVAHQHHQVALVRTVDNDVVILSIHFFSSLELSQLWVCLGSRMMRDNPIHSLSLCPAGTISRCLELPLFNSVIAVTLCHTLWDVARYQPDQPGRALTSEPQKLRGKSQHMHTLEHFAVVIYSKDCGLERVSEARLRSFTRGKTNTIWPVSTNPQNNATCQLLPDFHNWGWHKDRTCGWLPFWTILEGSSKAV